MGLVSNQTLQMKSLVNMKKQQQKMQNKMQRTNTEGKKMKRILVNYGATLSSLRGVVRKLLGVDMFIILMVVMVLWMYTKSKLIILYILNTCSLLYVSYTSINLLKMLYVYKKRICAPNYWLQGFREVQYAKL